MFTETYENNNSYGNIGKDLRRQLDRYNRGDISKYLRDCVICYAIDNLGMEAVSEITLMSYDELLDIQLEVKGL